MRFKTGTLDGLHKDEVRQVIKKGKFKFYEVLQGIITNEKRMVVNRLTCVFFTLKKRNGFYLV